MHQTECKYASLGRINTPDALKAEWEDRAQCRAHGGPGAGPLLQHTQGHIFKHLVPHVCEGLSSHLRSLQVISSY